MRLMWERSVRGLVRGLLGEGSDTVGVQVPEAGLEGEGETWPRR